MKLRVLIMALLTALLLVQSSTATAQKRKRTGHTRTRVDRWYVFISPDGDFTLSFPDKPNREADATGPVTPITNYGLYTENGMRFSVNFQGMNTYPNPRLVNEWN